MLTQGVSQPPGQGKLLVYIAIRHWKQRSAPLSPIGP